MFRLIGELIINACSDMEVSVVGCSKEASSLLKLAFLKHPVTLLPSQTASPVTDIMVIQSDFNFFWALIFSSNFGRFPPLNTER